MGRYYRHSVSIDVDPDEVIEQLDDREKAELFQKHMPRESVVVRQGLGEGDKPLSRFVEDAYLAAKALPNLPRELADLFWHVHGRAI